jgi:hypothetical protein
VSQCHALQPMGFFVACDAGAWRGLDSGALMRALRNPSIGCQAGGGEASGPGPASQPSHSRPT